jgi:hypothetical protein
MHFWTMSAAGLGLLALSATAGLSPATAATAIEANTQVPIVVAQSEPKKSETVTQKVKREVKEDTKSVKDSVKRTWKKMTGYKFDVGCPALIPLSHSTCTETGKNSADAQAKCQAKSPLCSVTAAK